MNSSLSVYLNDHLAGATFALHLLTDLQLSDSASVASLARELLPEIEVDKSCLESVLQEHNAEPALLRKASAWIAELASRAKLQLKEPLGIYEAVEILCLGVLGKRCLWTALQSGSTNGHTTIDFDELISRAASQYERLESLRMTLARNVFRLN